MRMMATVALALALTVPSVSAQQAGTQAQQMRELQREMARLEPESRATVRAMGRVPMVQVFGSRARLGVTLDLRKNPATDSIGAVLTSVTPSGPADKASLRAGDIITTFNGERLVGRYPAAGEVESEPGRKLWDFAQELARPGAGEAQPRAGRLLRHHRGSAGDPCSRGRGAPAQERRRDPLGGWPAGQQPGAVDAHPALVRGRGGREAGCHAAEASHVAHGEDPRAPNAAAGPVRPSVGLRLEPTVT